MTKTEESQAPNWLPQALTTAAALTIAANYLLYNHGPGAGWSIFFLLLASTIFLNRRTTAAPRITEIALATLLTASAIQMTIRPSFSNAIVLLTLTLIASTHYLQDSNQKSTPGRKLAEAIRNLALSPLRWLQATDIAARCGFAEAGNIAKKLPSTNTITRAFQIIIPAALITLPFMILLGKGNTILGSFITNTLEYFLDNIANVQPPSPGRIFFIGFIATLLLGLLWRTQPSKKLDKLFTKLSRNLPTPADHFVARWRTILILLAVNALFFIANSIDLTYLGAKNLTLPENLTYAQFVHQGTYTLIASAIIAAIVIGLLFQQDRSVTDRPPIRALALLWVAQNLLLIINVARRVSIYISDYHLSILRVHLLAFLVLVCTGFILLAIHIVRNKTFPWLITANLTAVFTLFATIQFWDTRKLVAEYNFQRALADHNKTLDIAYLKTLGPTAWPTIVQATKSNLSFDERNNATQALHQIQNVESYATEFEDWRDFQWKRSELRKLLTSKEKGAEAKS